MMGSTAVAPPARDRWDSQRGVRGRKVRSHPHRCRHVLNTPRGISSKLWNSADDTNSEKKTRGGRFFLFFLTFSVWLLTEKQSWGFLIMCESRRRTGKRKMRENFSCFRSLPSKSWSTNILHMKETTSAAGWERRKKQRDRERFI